MPKRLKSGAAASWWGVLGTPHQEEAAQRWPRTRWRDYVSQLACKQIPWEWDQHLCLDGFSMNWASWQKSDSWPSIINACNQWAVAANYPRKPWFIDSRSAFHYTVDPQGSLVGVESSCEWKTHQVCDSIKTLSRLLFIAASRRQLDGPHERTGHSWADVSQFACHLRSTKWKFVCFF